MPLRGSAIALAAAGLALVAAGCGGGSARPAAGSRPGGAGGQPGGNVVAISEFAYTPASLTVRVGEPVVFVNRGRIAHTVADTTPAGAIRSVLIRPRPLNPGEEQRVIFRHPGVVSYLCTFHPTLMKGRIVVRP